MIKSEEKIIRSPGGTRKFGAGRAAFYPVMEKKLHKEFLELRNQGLKVKQWWFRTRSKQLCDEIYPERKFKFKNSWFVGFKRPFGVSYRAQTNVHQTSGNDKRQLISEFHKLVRKQALYKGPGKQSEGEIGQFKLSDICNIDQSPLPFAFLAGKTYANKGDETIWVRGAGSGLEKRQCTLQVMLFNTYHQYFTC